MNDKEYLKSYRLYIRDVLRGKSSGLVYAFNEGQINVPTEFMENEGATHKVTKKADSWEIYFKKAGESDE